MRGLAPVLTCTLAFAAAFTLAAKSVSDTLEQPVVLRPMRNSNSLSAELSRCHSLGLAAQDDAGCKQARAENRQRFFHPEAR